MSESSDINAEFTPLPTPEDEDYDSEDPKVAAYRIAAWIMEEFEPGFVIIGSPNMASTATGYLYPDAVGIIINHDVDMTPFGLAAVLRELAEQLESKVNEVEEFVKGYADGPE